jgi:UDP-glucose 4-epimerase
MILGGCGFIGRHVALLLAAQGEDVVLCDRVPNAIAYPAALQDRIRWQSFDLQSADWDTLLEGVGTVHHYAWASLPATANADPAQDLALNTMPCLSLLEGMRRLGSASPRLIFTSSGGTVYGKLRRVPVHEDHPLAPITAYGAGKVAAELYLGLYNTLYGLDCRIARLANPFGAGQDLARGQGAATTFLHHALTHQPITIWGDGEVVRDYIHVSDAAAGLIALARMPRREGLSTFNIGSGQGVSLNGIILELETRLGRALEVKREPGRPFDVPVSVLDISLARDTLSWTPRLSFSDGMSRTLADLDRGASLATMH